MMWEKLDLVGAANAYSMAAIVRCGFSFFPRILPVSLVFSRFIMPLGTEVKNARSGRCGVKLPRDHYIRVYTVEYKSAYDATR